MNINQSSRIIKTIHLDQLVLFLLLLFTKRVPVVTVHINLLITFGFLDYVGLKEIIEGSLQNYVLLLTSISNSSLI